jgi:hypothetical protein
LTAAQEEQQRFGQLSSIAGQIGQSQLEGGLKGGAQLADLAGSAQEFGLRGAGALSTLGATERGVQQQNLETAYADFLRQQGYRQEQIDAALQTFKSISPAAPTAVQEYGYQPLNYQPESVSGLGTVGTGLSGFAALLSEANDLGWI